MTTKTKQAAGAIEPEGALTPRTQPPLDLAHALRPTNQGVRSTNLNPDWSGPPYLLGRIVAYVQPDGSDTEAKILRLDPDGTAVLLISVGTKVIDDVYQIQVPLVPLGRVGEVGTWHEADDG